MEGARRAGGVGGRAGRSWRGHRSEGAQWTHRPRQGCAIVRSSLAAHVAMAARCPAAASPRHGCQMSRRCLTSPWCQMSRRWCTSSSPADVEPPSSRHVTGPRSTGRGRLPGITDHIRVSPGGHPARAAHLTRALPWADRLTDGTAAGEGAPNAPARRGDRPHPPGVDRTRWTHSRWSLATGQGALVCQGGDWSLSIRSTPPSRTGTPSLRTRQRGCSAVGSGTHAQVPVAKRHRQARVWISSPSRYRPCRPCHPCHHRHRRHRGRE